MYLKSCARFSQLSIDELSPLKTTSLPSPLPSHSPSPSKELVSTQLHHPLICFSEHVKDVKRRGAENKF